MKSWQHMGIVLSAGILLKLGRVALVLQLDAPLHLQVVLILRFDVGQVSVSEGAR